MTDAAARPMDVMRRWFSPQRTPDLLAEDVVWRLSAGYPAPKHHWTGRNAVLEEFLPLLRAQFSSWGAVMSNLIEAEGGRVIATGEYCGTTPDGRAVAIPFLHIWVVAEGRIVSLDAVADWGCRPQG